MTISKDYLIGWVGGKKRLRKTLAPLFPQNAMTYVEPFGGAAWMMFYRDKWADVEIYNDLDGRLVNLFRTVKYHSQALIDEVKFMINSREMFLQYMNFEPLTEIQKAAKFLFLITRSYGKMGKDFATMKKSGGVANNHNLQERIDSIHKRLDRVIIEHLDFEQLIKKYDHEQAFFYCDPPYSCGAGYETTSTKDFDHERLCNLLKSIKGKFLLSYDDSPKIRELYKDFEIISVKRANGIDGKHQKNKVFNEVIIANYPIKDVADSKVISLDDRRQSKDSCKRAA